MWGTNPATGIKSAFLSFFLAFDSFSLFWKEKGGGKGERAEEEDDEDEDEET